METMDEEVDEDIEEIDLDDFSDYTICKSDEENGGRWNLRNSGKRIIIIKPN